jgi:hypothetical protein
MVVWFIVMIGLIAGCMWIDKKFFKDSKRGVTKTMASLLIITALWLTWLANSIVTPRIGAEVITKVPVDDDPMYECHTVWYDRKEDKYFYTIDSIWNPLKMSYRVYLDTEKVEQYIEIEEKLKEIDLFG